MSHPAISNRPAFRFPRTAIFLMLMTLLGTIIGIEMGRTTELRFSGETSATPSWVFPGLFVPVLALVCIAAGIGYAVLFITGRSGLHRFSNIRTDGVNKAP